MHQIRFRLWLRPYPAAGAPDPTGELTELPYRPVEGRTSTGTERKEREREGKGGTEKRERGRKGRRVDGEDRLDLLICSPGKNPSYTTEFFVTACSVAL